MVITPDTISQKNTAADHSTAADRAKGKGVE
jgi:hypothetical protein